MKTLRFTKWLGIVLCAAIWLGVMPLQAAECRKTGEVCVDGPSSHTISGGSVTRDCWQYKDTYECVDPNSVDYCAAISKIAGCNQTGSTCTEKAFNGDCLTYTNTYRCGTAVTPLPTNVVQLNSDYTITTDTIDRSQCASYDNNKSCTLAQQTCTEPGGTRIINGLSVTKDCWNWQYTYTCVAQNHLDYCIPLRQTAGCSEVSNTCKSTAWDKSCSEYERTFRCDGKQGDPLPSNITYLNTEYTLVKDQLDTSQCDPNKNNANCTLASHVCSQPGGTRNINGMNVYKDCWEWTDQYSCASTNLKNDCADLRANTNCTEQSSTCIDTLPAGQCGLLEHKFQCKTSDGTSTTTTTCGTGICINNVCTAPSTNPDSDFAQVVAGLEAQREGGTYFDQDTGQLFKGEASSCEIKLGGLGNCCKATGGGGTMSNSFLTSALGQGVKFFGKEAIHFLGSSYMYDALSSSGIVPAFITSAIYGEAGSEAAPYVFGSGGNGFGMYGITYAPGMEPPLTFDPYSFAIAVAIQLIQQYLQCSQPEQMLGFRKDQHLCTLVGSWCSQKFLGSCMTKSEGYCCYNSRLSRIINEQGRVQIGKSYGKPENPDCSGFTVIELSKIDFSRIDFSEFIDEIVPKNMDSSLITDQAQQTIIKQTANYFDTGKYTPSGQLPQKGQMPQQ